MLWKYHQIVPVCVEEKRFLLLRSHPESCQMINCTAISLVPLKQEGRVNPTKAHTSRQSTDTAVDCFFEEICHDCFLFAFIFYLLLLQKNCEEGDKSQPGQLRASLLLLCLLVIPFEALTPSSA